MVNKIPVSAPIEKLLLVSPWIDHSKPTCLAPSTLLIVPLTPLNSYIDCSDTFILKVVGSSVFGSPSLANIVGFTFLYLLLGWTKLVLASGEATELKLKTNA